MRQIKSLLDFQDHIEHAGEVRVVIFGASWCPHCPGAAKALDGDPRVALLKLDEMDSEGDSTDLANALEIDALPAVRRFTSGRPSGRMDGPASSSQLKAFVEVGGDSAVETCATCTTCGGAR